MKTAIITIGVSASGKTTWAEKFVDLCNSCSSESDPSAYPTWVNINRDDIRWSLIGVRDWSKWNWKREKEVSYIHASLIEQAANNGCNIVVSDTNLNPKFRNALIERLQSFGYTVEIKEFSVSFEEACARDTRRPNGVGYSVIAKQMEQWVEYKNSNVANTYDESLPSCAIVDIDGTLAHMHNRGAFDWDKVGDDIVDPVVRNIVNTAVVNKIFVFSGRDSICREQTEKWLEDNFIQYDYLMMRPEGDFRKDTVVKREMFDNHIIGKYNVSFVIDDRPCVCRMWREMELKVLQVGNPYIEF